MQIGSIFSGYGAFTASPAVFARTLSANPADTAAISSSSNSGGSSVDFTHMTRNQMTSYSDSLFKAGAIDGREAGLLSSAGLVFGKAGPNGTLIPLSPAEQSQMNHTPIDYIQYAKDQIAGLESRGETVDPQYGYACWQSMLQLMQARQGSAIGVNVTACRRLRRESAKNLHPDFQSPSASSQSYS